MAFQPLGYRFDIRTKLALPATRRAIRQRWKGWFAPVNGPRGWMIGPFVCLWLSAFDRYGPLLVGVMSNDGAETKISGRAGSDLNGVLLALFLLPVVVLCVFLAVKAGQITPLRASFLAGLITFFVGVAAWWGHLARREAEPLVRFLKDAVATSGAAVRARRLGGPVSPDIKLDLNGRMYQGPVTAATIYEAMLSMEERGFLILERAPHVYMQTAGRDGGFVLEKREGSHLHHFRAVRLGAPIKPKGGKRDRLSFDEAVDACLAYASGSSPPNVFRWELMKMPAER